MHSTVNPKQNIHPETRLISVLSRHLLTPSVLIENQSQTQKEAEQDAIKCLRSLERLFTLQYPAIPEHQPEMKARSLPQHPLQESQKNDTSKLSVQYSSENKKYQAALDNPSTLQAILALKSGLQSSSSLKNSISPQDPDYFKPLNPPAIEAKLKTTAVSQRSLMSRIFRSREESP